jgi:hypothetical protein
VGDRVTVIDGVKLGNKKKLMQVIQPQASHSFSVLRPKDSALGAAAKGGFFGFGRKKKNSLLMADVNEQGDAWGLS